jgi:hypothetical protein
VTADEKRQLAAMVDEANVEFKLLAYVTDEPTARRVLWSQTAVMPLELVIPWESLLVGAA